MGNIMTSMWTAVAGLQTNQSALNTSAHNVMNANTEGYTRQRAVLSANKEYLRFIWLSFFNT